MPAESTYPTVNALSTDDYVRVVNDPQGSPLTRNITYGNFFTDVAVPVTYANTVTFAANVTISANVNFNVADIYITDTTTPTSNADVVSENKIWADSDYIYVAVANNSIRRVALTDF